MSGLVINPYLVQAAAAGIDVATTASGTFDDLLGAGVATTLPTGVANSNLLIYVVTCRLAASVGLDVSINTPSGYTSLNGSTGTFRPASANGVAGTLIVYKVAGSSEAAPTFTEQTQACAWAWVAYRITGYTGVPEAVFTATPGSSLDPATLTPSWGSASNLWIAAATVGVVGTVSGYPTGYTDDQVTTSIDGTGSANCGIGIASKIATATSDNPAAFTFSASGNSSAATIAVKSA